MESRFILPFVIRFLPTIILLGLAFWAASDKNTRQRWTQMLYQAGSLRPEQRDDPKVQGGVKTPFIVIALLLLFSPIDLMAFGIAGPLGPVNYYLWATRKIEAKSDLGTRKPVTELEEKMQGKDPAANEGAPAAEPTAAPQPGITNPPPPGQGGAPVSGGVSGQAPVTGGPGGLAQHNRQ